MGKKDIHRLCKLNLKDLTSAELEYRDVIFQEIFEILPWTKE